VGRDNGSLTEQQTKGTVKMTTQMRGKHNTNHTTQTAALPNHRCCALLSRERVPAALLPPHRNPA